MVFLDGRCVERCILLKADRAETYDRYSISEWWLEPYAEGPGAHVYDDEDCIFHILEGTASLFVGEEWFDAPQGPDVCSPVGVPRDFANRTGQRMGLLNVTVLGRLQVQVAGISKWLRENP